MSKKCEVCGDVVPKDRDVCKKCIDKQLKKKVDKIKKDG